MEIKQIKETVTKYEIEGFVFDLESEAFQFKTDLEKLLALNYYEVTYKPDLTEGRGYYSKMCIVTDSWYVNSVYQYLSVAVGKPIAFVQGVQPMPNYGVSSKKKFETLKEVLAYLKTDVETGIGDYRKSEPNDFRFINESGLPEHVSAFIKSEVLLDLLDKTRGKGEK